MFRVLMTGDLVGRAGRRVLEERLYDLRQQREIDFVVSNVENAAAGFSITPRIAQDLFAAGVDIMTSGNHIFDKREVLEYIEKEPRLLRPANYAPGVPGKGRWVGKVKGLPVAVLNFQGRAFMPPSDDPFRSADAQLAALEPAVKIILVDMHGEATAEKLGMGRYLDGRVSAVVGTHTHVPTADERIMPRGTGYITDVGMTGCYDSVIGMDTQKSLKRFVQKLPERFEVAEGLGTISGVLLDINESTGLCQAITRLRVNENTAKTTIKVA